MKPTAELSQEHQAILRMIWILERMSQKLESGEKVDVGHLEKAVDFIKGFADTCHHAKEEDLLFPAMEKAGIPRTGGPLGVMLNEHVAGRGFVKGMTDAIAGLKKGDKAAGRDFAENAAKYGALLSQHIFKEDRILYPMADARLTPDQQKELEACFADVEEKVVGHGKHEEYHRLLKELESVYLT
ncbi:MAG TPA: hemerythrin domain-containing protein [Burkholderiales bacterium]|nr:hemerythrin domain-containing protein [Burkholderiales bacterium]